MINYGNFYFASAPLTGVSWFTRSCQLAGLGYGSRERAYESFPEIRNGKIRISLMRHPCMWVTDLYLMGSKLLRNIHLAKFQELYRDGSDFTEFVDRFLKLSDQLLYELIFSYEADSFMRAEDFPFNFTGFVQSVGVDNSLLEIEHFHRYPESIALTKEQWRPDQWRDVCRAERQLCQFADYY